MDIMLIAMDIIILMLLFGWWTAITMAWQNHLSAAWYKYIRHRDSARKLQFESISYYIASVNDQMKADFFFTVCLIIFLHSLISRAQNKIPSPCHCCAATTQNRRLPYLIHSGNGKLKSCGALYNESLSCFDFHFVFSWSTGYFIPVL